MNSTPFDKVRLFQELQQWPLADLRTLCFYFELEAPALDLAYDNLVGETSTEKVQAFIRHLQRFERFQSWGHLRRILEANFPFMDATFLPALVNDPPSAPTPPPPPPIPTPEPPVHTVLSPPRSFIGIEWLEIPAGEFWMGDNDGYENEMPCHLVDLPIYWMAKTPITNAQYRVFLQATGQYPPPSWINGEIPEGKGNHPVVELNWDEAMYFASWVGEEIGRTVLLPSEAEWEKAARGGVVLPSGPNPLPKRTYPWGDVFDAAHCNTGESGIGDTTPVDEYAQTASPYGVLDMSGNVWEWTRSLWRPYPYVAGDGRENIIDHGLCIVRGGAFSDSFEAARTGARLDTSTAEGSFDVGVRLVCVSFPAMLV